MVDRDYSIKNNSSGDQQQAGSNTNVENGINISRVKRGSSDTNNEHKHHNNKSVAHSFPCSRSCPRSLCRRRPSWGNAARPTSPLTRRHASCGVPYRARRAEMTTRLRLRTREHCAQLRATNRSTATRFRRSLRTLMSVALQKGFQMCPATGSRC